MCLQWLAQQLGIKGDRIDLHAWRKEASTFQSRIQGSAFFLRPRMELRQANLSLHELWPVIAHVKTATRLQKSQFGVHEWDIVCRLVDLGILTAENQPGSAAPAFVLGPRPLVDLLSRMTAPLAAYAPPGPDVLFNEALLLEWLEVQSLPLAMLSFAVGAKKVRDGATVAVPTEAAYLDALAVIAMDVLGIEAVTREVPLPGDLHVDMLLRFPLDTHGRLSMVELVAHARAGPESRDGSVAGHIRRMRDDYLPARSGSASVWVVNFILEDVAIKQETLADPQTMNVLHVVHDREGRPVRFVVHRKIATPLEDEDREADTLATGVGNLRV